MKKKYDIVIVGAGPTGIVLANLLAKSSLDVAILEKQNEVYPIPRATHIDEESIRNFQQTGLIDKLLKHTTTFGKIDIVGKNGRLLFEETVEQKDSEHYFSASCFFDQVAFEKILRKGLVSAANIDLLLEAEATDIRQSKEKVTVEYQQNGVKNTINAQYAVACDGGRSMVRQKMGIKMDSLEEAREWVIVDVLLNNQDNTHLLPKNFRYVFDEKRLTIYAHGIGLNRRWEFQLHQNEQMPDEETIKSWVAQYIDLQKVKIIRIAKYAHNSLVAQSWKKERVFLAGDAAHMMPPSAGQGLCSGVRDAVNLAWKLAAVVSQSADPNLLDSYEAERKPHLFAILKKTLSMGAKLKGDSKLQRLWRNISIKTIENIKPIKDYLKVVYNSPIPLRHGYLNLNTRLAGQHLPQFAIDKNLSDNIIGYKEVVLMSHKAHNNVALCQKYKDKNILILNELMSVENSPFPKWLNRHKLDIVHVRPDKIIFETQSLL